MGIWRALGELRRLRRQARGTTAKQNGIPSLPGVPESSGSAPASRGAKIHVDRAPDAAVTMTHDQMLVRNALYIYRMSTQDQVDIDSELGQQIWKLALRKARAVLN